MAINVHYIRAAIEYNTGQRLGLKEVVSILLSEGLITEAQARTVVKNPYDRFYEGASSDGNIGEQSMLLPVDMIIRD